MNVITLTAASPRSGKDTLAMQVIERSDKRVFTIAFGDALRVETAKLFHIPRAKFIEWSMKERVKDEKMSLFCPLRVNNKEYFDMLIAKGFGTNDPMSIRQHLQLFGNDFTKGVKGNTCRWVDEVEYRLVEAKSHGAELAIVTDCRFPEEADMLRSFFDSLFVKVTRSGDWPSHMKVETNGHVAETLIDKLPCDLVVENRFGDPDGMFDQIKPHL